MSSCSRKGKRWLRVSLCLVLAQLCGGKLVSGSYWQHTATAKHHRSDGSVAWSQHQTTLVPPQQSFQQQQPPVPIHHQQQAVLQQPPPPLTPTDPMDGLDLPHVDSHQVSLSLRLACELNRRLQAGVRLRKGPNDANDDNISHRMDTQQPLRGGYVTQPTSLHHAVHIHPSQTWQPPIPATQWNKSDGEDDELTLFHAKAPRPSDAKRKRRRGAARWGPDVHLYLEHLWELTGESRNDDTVPPQQQRLWILSMLYLDRACSVETSRGASPKCPFVTPRTVHRLVMTAFLLAHRALNASDMAAVSRLESRFIESLGIPQTQLERMQEWMGKAQGETGLYVSPTELAQWTHMWERTWNKNKRQSPVRIQRQPNRSDVFHGPAPASHTSYAYRY